LFGNIKKRFTFAPEIETKEKEMLHTSIIINLVILHLHVVDIPKM